MKDFNFNLFGSVWTVTFKDKVYHKNDDGTMHWVWAETDLVKRNIKVSSKNEEDEVLAENEVKLSLLHEIVHTIFSTGQYLNNNEDEPLVEWTARCINALIEQKILKL